MSAIVAFFAYLRTIIEMWAILKPIIDRLKSTPKQDRQRVAKAILEASKKADETGDTSGYENEIKRGRLNV